MVGRFNSKETTINQHKPASMLPIVNEKNTKSQWNKHHPMWRHVLSCVTSSQTYVESRVLAIESLRDQQTAKLHNATTSDEW